MYAGSYNPRTSQPPYYPGFSHVDLAPEGYVFPTHSIGYQNSGIMEHYDNPPGNWGPPFRPQGAPMPPNQNGWCNGIPQFTCGRPPIHRNHGPRGPHPFQNGFDSDKCPPSFSGRRDLKYCDRRFANRGHRGGSKHVLKSDAEIENSCAEGDSSMSSESSAIRCEPCEKSFNSLRDLQCHEKTHVQCEAEGCKFIASRKIVNLHHIQNHAEGKFRIRLFTNEDIEKWKAERRRNYPTLSNLKRKADVEEKKRETGAVLGSTEFKYVEQMNSKRNGRRKHNGGFKRVYKNSIPEQEPMEGTVNCDGKNSGIDSKVLHAMEHCTTKMPTGTSVSSANGQSKENGIPNALQSIGMTYSSDEGESDNNNKVKSDGGNKLTIRGKKVMADGASLFNVNGRHVSPEGTQNRNNGTLNRKSKHAQNDLPTPQPKRRPTLLEMLLANDIRKERNTILQCVRHIVSKNFFES